MTPTEAELLQELEPTIARLRALPAPEPTVAMRQQFQVGAFLDGFKMGSRGVREPELWEGFLRELEARDKELDALADLDARSTTEEVAAAVAAIRRYWSENYLRFAASCMALRKDRIRKQQFAAAHRNVGRNDPCPCGSGKKLKRCCLM